MKTKLARDYIYLRKEDRAKTCIRIVGQVHKPFAQDGLAVLRSRKTIKGYTWRQLG